MAGVKIVITEASIKHLQALLPGTSVEDCKILIEEYGENGDSLGVIETVFEQMEAAGVKEAKELIWHIRENPNFRSTRKSKSQGKGQNAGSSDQWFIAKSKSSVSVNKQASTSTIHSRSLSANFQVEPTPTQSLPYSGTQNPINILRTPKWMDTACLRRHLSTYLNDKETRNFFFDVFEKRSKRMLVIMRGASGSGKSTLASIIWAITDTGEICSADQHFVNRFGQYNFDKQSLGEAHAISRTRCQVAMQRGDSPVIIDNTNTREDEMMPYVVMAVEHNYEIKIIEPKTEWKCNPKILSQKTIHGVPRRSIQDQLERFESTTVQSLVSKAVRKNGLSLVNYQPHIDSLWESTEVPSPFKFVDRFETAPVNSKGFSAMPTIPKPKPLVFVPSSSPRSTTPVISSPNKAIQQPWTEPLTSCSSPTPRLLSDLLPDLHSPITARNKKIGRKNMNSGPALQPPPLPLPVFEDPAHIAFKKLSKHFPNVDELKLKDVFDLHEGDLDICASVLLEQGELLEVDDWLSVPDLESTSVETLKTSDVPNPLPVMGAGAVSETDELANMYPDIFYTETDFKPPSIKSDDASSEEGDGDGFEMAIPIDFARTLLKAYGHPDDEERSLSDTELKIKVNTDIAFEFYKCLYLNMYRSNNNRGQSSSNESTTSSNSPTSSDDEINAIAISLSQMELETTCGDPKMENIIDLEYQICEQETKLKPKKFATPNRTMAQNINFSLLKQEYEYLDSTVIDEIYRQCELDVEKTKALLNEIYIQTSNDGFSSQGNQQQNLASTWSLKYNPDMVQKYTPDEIKFAQKHYAELERKWTSDMDKIKKYQENCNTNDPNIKSYYGMEVKELTASLKVLTDEMQYYQALVQNAKHKNDQILDLHGLRINGAMTILKDFLMVKEGEFKISGTPKMILLIITGQGKHSRNGCPVLQPAVKNFLSQKRYKFHSGKPGSYTVVLTPDSVARKK